MLMYSLKMGKNDPGSYVPFSSYTVQLLECVLVINLVGK